MQKVLILVLIAACMSCSNISSEEITRTTQSVESVQSTMPISTPDASLDIPVPIPDFPGMMLGLVSEGQHYKLISVDNFDWYGKWSPNNNSAVQEFLDKLTQVDEVEVQMDSNNHIMTGYVSSESFYDDEINIKV